MKGLDGIAEGIRVVSNVLAPAAARPAAPTAPSAIPTLAPVLKPSSSVCLNAMLPSVEVEGALLVDVDDELLASVQVDIDGEVLQSLAAVLPEVPGLDDDESTLVDELVDGLEVLPVDVLPVGNVFPVVVEPVGLEVLPVDVLPAGDVPPVSVPLLTEPVEGEPEIVWVYGPPDGPLKPALHEQAQKPLLPAGEFVLAAHALHDESPVTSLYLPAAHSVQSAPLGLKTLRCTCTHSMHYYQQERWSQQDTLHNLHFPRQTCTCQQHTWCMFRQSMWAPPPFGEHVVISKKGGGDHRYGTQIPY